MCVKITKKSRKKNIAGIMEIDEVKTQETATTADTATTATTAASGEATIGAMIDTNVSDTGDASHAEERADDGQSDNERPDAKRTRGKRSKTLKLSKTSKALKGVRVLTSEERAVIIAKAKEIGVAEAAREFGINYYTIYTWLKKGKKKASSKSEQSAKPAAQTQGKASNRKSSKSHQKKEDATTAQVDEIKEMKDMKEIKREYIAEDMPVAPVEAVVPAKTIEAKELNEPSEVTMGKAVYASPAQIDEKHALLIENAILRERISAQKAEIEKLQAAIKSLMV